MLRLAPVLALLLLGCSDRDPAISDATMIDAGRIDAGMDASVDGGGVDARPGPDGSAEDAGPGDAGRRDECGEELCDDGLDGDCDGTVDEGCPCVPGETARCFRGDPSARGVGRCRDGTMLCESDFEFGTWGECTGDVLAGAESCDASGVDEDCDGAPNEGCECSDGDPPVACGSDVGACEAGTQACVDGMRTACEGAVAPVAETCNGVDDDCDGEVDERITRPCGSDVGACRMGRQVCVDGEWSECVGGTAPRDELCDGLDDDCDGEVDEEITRACGIDEGRCEAGTQTCEDAAFTACEGRVDPIDETCNDVDDDCDGEVDERLTRPCGTDTGACVAGTETCVAGEWGACEGATEPTDEVCEGEVDESCDGTVDEGCECTLGMTRPCGIDTGVCETGTQTCDASGAWGPCEDAVDPGMEACDGVLDEDCDGTVDEGCDCVTGMTRACGSDVGLCETGLETCDVAGRWGVCAGGRGPVPEVCNGEDDDCDGGVDEMGVCPRFPPTVSCPMGATVLVGETAPLSGGGTDPDGGPVSFDWTVAAAPVGSTAAPAPRDAASTSFTPDVAGAYTLRLCVTDDELETRCCTVRVTATPRCEPPPRPVLSVCGTSWDRRPIVEFAPLPAGLVLELFKDADAAPYATVTMDGQNHHRPAAELGAGAPPPGASTSLYGRHCLESDRSCCSASDPVTVGLVEACTTAIAPTSSNIVFSEYVVDGDGDCPGASCEAGEAIEITNLSHCPIALSGHHFGYCNPASCSGFRWMNFGASDVIPPRGVYVAIRNRGASSCPYPFLGSSDPGLFGLKISTLTMNGDSTASGWFNNAGGGSSVLRVATGAWVDISSGTTLEIISPYSGAAGECQSIGFDARGRCGEVSAVATPTAVLAPNQLGRLWRPCDAVVAPVPACL